MLVRTIDDVVPRLEEIIAWAQQTKSRLGYFAALYRKMTLQVRAGITAGSFDDSERMAHIGVVFANRYFLAVDHYRNGHRPTNAWLLSFAAAQRWWPIVLQHLLLGMNAHINLDLGIAIARSVPHTSLAQVQGDYNKINEILATLIDQVQAELTEIWPFYECLDWVTGRHDEVIINFSLRKARDQAWRVAERLASLPEAEQEREIVALDAAVEIIGHFVLHPGILTRALLTVVRVGERGAIPDIIDILK
jgi:hypothetical protein